VNSPNLLSFLDLITPRNRSRGFEFLRIGFHRTNYVIHESMSGAMRQFNEVIGIFDFSLTRDQFLNRIRLTFLTYPTLHRFSESIVHCCCIALSFSTVNMLSGRFYSPHQHDVCFVFYVYESSFR
jgi:hypothetical protein